MDLKVPQNTKWIFPLEELSSSFSSFMYMIFILKQLQLNNGSRKHELIS